MWQNGARRNVYRLLVGKPEGKRPLGKPKSRWIDNIKMNLVERGWGDVAQDRGNLRGVVNVVMNLWVP
jgi:hypothetical protein